MSKHGVSVTYNVDAGALEALVDEAWTQHLRHGGPRLCSVYVWHNKDELCWASGTILLDPRHASGLGTLSYAVKGKVLRAHGRFFRDVRGPLEEICRGRGWELEVS